MIKLRFIGEDGSMGLRYRKIYKIGIECRLECICVYWDGGFCPYSSPQTFAANWEAV